MSNYHENELARIAVDTCLRVHRGLGPGLLESVYERVLYYEFRKMNLQVSRQKTIGVKWDEINLDIGFRADLILEKKLIIEIKSVESIHPVYKKVLLTYLRLSDIKLGLLVNFHEELIKNGIYRIVNNLEV